MSKILQDAINHRVDEYMESIDWLRERAEDEDDRQDPPEEFAPGLQWYVETAI
jgi:hypothetical protein